MNLMFRNHCRDPVDIGVGRHFRSPWASCGVALPPKGLCSIGTNVGRRALSVACSINVSENEFRPGRGGRLPARLTLQQHFLLRADVNGWRSSSQRTTKDGIIVIEAGRFRTQEQNRADARARLTALVAKAAEPPPPPRKKTGPSKGAVERRLKSKAGRGTIKKLRGRVEND
ncbi:hypothetical protein [Mesorhizobium sp. AD1-1]|uniref:hypothetical protein n=1 Tax=Mesorhizobium sp. AD1-1 TaxID=2876621 RepID=UPI001CC9A086|nr:hypothetical protein [Mesorhizobium sp. AD1-1]